MVEWKEEIFQYNCIYQEALNTKGCFSYELISEKNNNKTDDSLLNWVEIYIETDETKEVEQDYFIYFMQFNFIS